ncbi:MAG: hypothetical protein ACOC2U_04385 [bacterium]
MMLICNSNLFNYFKEPYKRYHLNKAMKRIYKGKSKLSFEKLSFMKLIFHMKLLKFLEENITTHPDYEIDMVNELMKEFNIKKFSKEHFEYVIFHVLHYNIITY